MPDIDTLFQIIGNRIREGRDSCSQKYSQAKLAKVLGVSRASIVNIEAGRQHAPLDLLWRIAIALEMELVQLIPRRAELVSFGTAADLDEGMLMQIKLESKGNAKLQKSLTNVVGRLLTSIDGKNKDSSS